MKPCTLTSPALGIAKAIVAARPLLALPIFVVAACGGAEPQGSRTGDDNAVQGTSGGVPASGGTGMSDTSSPVGSTAMPTDPSTFTVTSPTSGAAVSGTISVTGLAGSSWVNVAVFEPGDDYAKVGSDVTPSGGSYNLSIDTTRLGSGSKKLVVIAFSVPAGQAGGTTSTIDLVLNVDNSGAAPVPGGAALPPVCNGRKVIFRDDFDGTSLDRTKWNTQYCWGDCTLGGNAEQQCYADSQVSVHDGQLHLVATPKQTTGKGAPAGGLPYASGMISSGFTPSAPTKFDFQYGYFEARVKIPAGKGLWPAFWTNNTDGTWPPEIDVMEILGHEPSKWHGTYHWLDGSNAHKADGTAWTGPDFSQGFHTFGIDWQPGRLDWYIDGVVRKSFTNASVIQSKRAYLVANLAVGGYWPGNPDAATVFPADYAIDYIFVCQ